jgi:putative acetyltransferase
MTIDAAIRVENPADVAGVRRTNEAAFGRPNEADLVDRIRAAASGGDVLSIVAAIAGGAPTDVDAIVGHALFTPAAIGRCVGAAFGPVAVRPERQRRGAGGAMIRWGLDELRRRRVPFVIVLGHPAYYPRFGFVPASRHGVGCPWPVPDEVFMILPLDAAAMRGISGTARYLPAFDHV